MEILFTKDAKWLKKWDEYILKQNRGSHLLLSDWNKSFSSYGFSFEVGICVENDTICGGFTAIIAKALFFKFYIVPYGPIVSEGYEKQLDNLITTVPKRANYYNCCYAHITLPFSTTPNPHVYTILPELPALKSAKEGHLFKFVYSSNGLNWVDFKNATDEEALIDCFKVNMRRNIRSSERKELELKYLNSEEEIKLGYDLCLENAKNNNYSLREWPSFKETLINMVANGTAKFLGAFLENKIKGATLIIKSGNYYTYILGGTVKEKPDVLAGHFLQWQAIKLSFAEGLSGYNISLGGSSGVVQLKNNYADEQIIFEKSKHHWVLKPNYFKVYLLLEKKIKSNRKIVSKVLTLLKK
jgi:lipid II:glycine glycyltransferase (peptidoglycan interpeptide bridge formation enzyme)